MFLIRNPCVCVIFARKYTLYYTSNLWRCTKFHNDIWNPQLMYSMKTFQIKLT